MMKLGIDLGGTKIEIIALGEQGKVHLRQRIATPQNDYAAIIRAIGTLIAAAEAKTDTCTMVGIGTPGAISPATGLMKNANSTCLNGKPFLQDLEHYLGKTVRIENDANCFALSEAMEGAGKGADSVFGVIVGTGVGAGIVIHQQVVRGVNAIGGEWGHNPLPWPQPEELPGMPCYCGKQGCIETWLSGTGLAARFWQKYRRKLSAPQIVAAAEAGDVVCEQALQHYEDLMARSLAHVINLLDPALGGGLSNVSRLYQHVPERWGRYVFSDQVATRLLAPVFGDSSGVRGAAWLCE